MKTPVLEESRSVSILKHHRERFYWAKIRDKTRKYIDICFQYSHIYLRILINSTWDQLVFFFEFFVSTAQLFFRLTI